MILRDQRMYTAERELTTDLMSVAMEYGAEGQEDTRFGNQTRISTPGLLISGWSVEGYWSAEQPDEFFFSNVGVSEEPFSVMVEDGTNGSLAYTLLSDYGNYEFLGTVGDNHHFTVGGTAASPLVRGQVLWRGTVNSAGAKTAYQLGVVSAGSGTLYAAIHVTSVSGGTPALTAEIESDDAQGFATPSSRITLVNNASAPTSAWGVRTGAAGDDWWRVNFTTVSGSFEVAVVAGVIA